MENQATKLRALARQSRVLARSQVSPKTAESANRLADLYDRQAAELTRSMAA